MARQIAVRIPAELEQKLTLASRKLEETRSQIVRRALREFLNAAVKTGSPAKRVQDLIGSLDSRQPDLAEKHLEYILESLRNGR